MCTSPIFPPSRVRKAPYGVMRLTVPSMTAPTSRSARTPPFLSGAPEFPSVPSARLARQYEGGRCSAASKAASRCGQRRCLARLIEMEWPECGARPRAASGERGPPSMLYARSASASRGVPQPRTDEVSSRRRHHHEGMWDACPIWKGCEDCRAGWSSYADRRTPQCERVPTIRAAVEGHRVFTAFGPRVRES